MDENSLIYTYNESEDQSFDFKDADVEYAYNYSMQRVSNAFDELADLASFLQDSPLVEALGAEKFSKYAEEIEDETERVEKLYEVIIQAFEDNKLITPKEL